MVDATTRHEALSFMDGSSGYNRIRMALSDEEMTAFKTPKEIYCYKVMPFGLKNVGATYQRAMQKVFDYMLHKYVECYVDDLVVKSKRRPDHLKDLKVVHQDIEIEQSKIDAIQKMPRSKSLHDLRSLQGRLTYIRRFISNLAVQCQPFQKLMRKGENFVWDESCQNAFDSIKKYLLSPPVLGALVTWQAINIVHYCTGKAFTVHLVAKVDPIKYVLSRPIISGHLAKWAILLQQYDIVYIPQKAIKGQVLADFLADHPISSD
ncbi:uncharacterized protein E6C27_scaffold65G00160 [Cucumis melo var. makuwa]|uniref:Reverse transcriptase domain-containing protein n=1 Tax=Cucumis melo var. makuwa TaxID=1194695 RepID=A0A5A7SSA6_CUCMM|nr:uncharacterized protein E6C27_scaffold65G00160 [Cucumis melo var. makuwa]